MSERFALLAREFPDFPLDSLPAIPEAWEDTSWHNDASPSFRTRTRWQVHIDYPNPADREGGNNSTRFVAFPLTSEGEIMEGLSALDTDDWQRVIEVTGRSPIHGDPDTPLGRLIAGYRELIETVEGLGDGTPEDPGTIEAAKHRAIIADYLNTRTEEPAAPPPLLGFTVEADIRALMAENGFEEENTGGGCVAWGRNRIDSQGYILICNEDQDIIGDPDAHDWMLGIYSEDGSGGDVEGQNFFGQLTLADAVAKAKDFPAPPDDGMSVRDLAQAAREIDDADYASERQIKAEERFALAANARLSHAARAEYEVYCHKATTDERIDKALALLAKEGFV